VAVQTSRARKAAPARPAPKTAAARERERTRTNDPDRTKANIIDIATQEFSEKGLSGARIDEIAERTQTSKRMIYYYFESKEGLYRAVLEDRYRRIRSIEADLDLEHKPPMQALADLVRFTIDYQMANPDFVRLVMVENIHHGEHIAQLSQTQQEGMSAIGNLRDIIERGMKEGVMRKGLDAIDVHMSISALCVFNVANRHTFSTIFKIDMASPTAAKKRREAVTEMVLRYVAA
jgi:AcrR family transcriptional regulator